MSLWRWSIGSSQTACPTRWLEIAQTPRPCFSRIALRPRRSRPRRARGRPRSGRPSRRSRGRRSPRRGEAAHLLEGQVGPLAGEEGDRTGHQVTPWRSCRRWRGRSGIRSAAVSARRSPRRPPRAARGRVPRWPPRSHGGARGSEVSSTGPSAGSSGSRPWLPSTPRGVERDDRHRVAQAQLLADQREPGASLGRAVGGVEEQLGRVVAGLAVDLDAAGRSRARGRRRASSSR